MNDTGRLTGIPVRLTQPKELPWYELWRLIMLTRAGSPISTKYWRTSFNADSLASDPEERKMACDSPP